ncbi:glycosyltransferase involved in cell wall biosynthesis [Kaistia defluvii]|uniref:Glycosyltransferase involved in cell wall biosynthesis n=1 Tax=Kaistia defluvii TaxID=410841 RepID=A0ABV2QT70_9HYPH
MRSLPGTQNPLSPSRSLARRRAILGKTSGQIGVLHQYDAHPLRVPRPAKNGHGGLRISIVTPSYNQGQFVERTLESVLGQGYPQLEYVLQDGGSTDMTADVALRYVERLSRYESAKDNGQTHAINLGFRGTSGEVMAYLNSDDLLLPGSLAHVAAYFTNNPDVDVVYGDRILIDENDDEIGRWVLPAHDARALRLADYVPQETLFWRRRIWDQVGGLDESFRFAMDWDLLLRFQEAGAKIVHLPRFMGAFRIHLHQKTSTELDNRGAEEMARLRLRSLGMEMTAKEIHAGLAEYRAAAKRSVWMWRLKSMFGLDGEVSTSKQFHSA